MQIMLIAIGQLTLCFLLLPLLVISEKSRKELYVNAYARRCLPQFPRQVTSLLMFGIARKNRYYCNYTKGKSDILQGAKCLNAIKSTGAQCLSTTIQDMIAIRYAPTEGKIAKTCW